LPAGTPTEEIFLLSAAISEGGMRDTLIPLDRRFREFRCVHVNTFDSMEPSNRNIARRSWEPEWEAALPFVDRPGWYGLQAKRLFVK
jgi:hypothetical protein